MQREISPYRFASGPDAAVKCHDGSDGHVNDPEKERPDIAVGGQYRVHDSRQCSDAGENQHEVSGSGLLQFINIGQYHSHGHTRQDKDIEP